MTPFHIAFILFNMAIPGWIYFSSSVSTDTPYIKWKPWQHSMEQIVEASGGFEGCSDSDVVRYVRQLCEKSMEEWTEKDSVIMERASSTIVFSCEVRSDATFVQWRLEATEDADIKCQPVRGGESIKASPAFVFDRKGLAVAIEFSARNGQRQAVNTANCRRKLKLTLERNIKTTTWEEVERMPRLKSDPQDFAMANRMCFEYDIAAEWEDLRKVVAR